MWSQSRVPSIEVVFAVRYCAAPHKVKIDNSSKKIKIDLFICRSSKKCLSIQLWSIIITVRAIPNVVTSSVPEVWPGSLWMSYCSFEQIHVFSLSNFKKKLTWVNCHAGQEDIFRMITVVRCQVVTTWPAPSITTVHVIKCNIQTALHIIIKRPTGPAWWAIIAHLLTDRMSFCVTKVVITDCATIISEKSPNSISILNCIAIIVD